MRAQKGYVRLGLFELQEIHVMRGAGRGIREISRAISRSASTVLEELRGARIDLGKIHDDVSPLERGKERHERAKTRRCRRGKRKRLKSGEIRSYVIRRVREDRWSPEAISARIGEDIPNATISPRAIYYFIKQERRDLMAYLPEGGKPKRQRVSHRRGKLRCGAPEKRRIEARPFEANERTKAGHWEGDTVVSRRGTKGGIATLRDRKTRLMRFLRLPSLEAQEMKTQLLGVFNSMHKDLRHTVTFDNGVEFSSTQMMGLETSIPGLSVYYCNPYSPTERGTNENGNRLLRRFFPKGTDLSAVTFDELKRVENLLNDRPMKCLQWRTPREAQEMELRSIRNRGVTN